MYMYIHGHVLCFGVYKWLHLPFLLAARGGGVTVCEAKVKEAHM